MTDSKSIKIRGKEYNIHFPNVGEYYSIETAKQKLGKGFYNVLLGNPTKAAQDALDMIDIEATLTVLCSDLLDDLKVDKFSQLGLSDYKEIKEIYLNEVQPFLKEVSNLLNS